MERGRRGDDGRIDFVGGIRGMSELEKRCGEGWAVAFSMYPTTIEQLMAVAAYDQVADGLSAVYTFFDPELEKRGPGRLAILWQIEEARRLGLHYLYLGYWIAETPKMSYKTDYRPIEKFFDGRWIRE